MDTWDLEPAQKFAYNALFLAFIAGLLLAGSVAYAAARFSHWSIRRSLTAVESGLFTATVLAVLVASLT